MVSRSALGSIRAQSQRPYLLVCLLLLRWASMLVKSLHKDPRAHTHMHMHAWPFPLKFDLRSQRFLKMRRRPTPTGG